MRILKSNSQVYSVLSAGILALELVSCGGKEQPPPVAPAPVVSAAPAPVAPTAAPVATPAPVAAPAPAESEAHHGHKSHVPMVNLLYVELPQVGLTAEQKATVDAIGAELEKQAVAFDEPRKQLGSDVADGVKAGKLDKAKVDADVKKIEQAADATVGPVQDALNKLHKTLDPAQRKKLVELVRAKMTEHSDHEMGGHAMGAHGEHGKGEHEKGEHEKGAKAEHEKGEHEKGAKAEHEKGEHEKGADSEHEHGEHGRIAKLTELLGLSPQQAEKLKAKLEADEKSEKAKMKEHMATMQKQMKAFCDAFESEKFDAKALGAGKHAGEMVKMMSTKRIRFVEAVLSLLTAEQYPKFADHIRQYDATND